MEKFVGKLHEIQVNHANLGCGLTNYTEFNAAEKWNRTWYKFMNSTNATAQDLLVYQSVVPIACCELTEGFNLLEGLSATTDLTEMPLNDIDCPIAPRENNSYIDVGCYDAVYNDYVVKYYLAEIIIGLCIIIGILITIPMSLVACMLVEYNGNKVTPFKNFYSGEQGKLGPVQ